MGYVKGNKSIYKIDRERNGYVKGRKSLGLCSSGLDLVKLNEIKLNGTELNEIKLNGTELNEIKLIPPSKQGYNVMHTT